MKINFLVSSGKGVAHTLARRAAFLLSTDEHKLAVRDLSVALEYGGLEAELLDFLLTHHTEDEEKIRAKNEASLDNAINAMKNAKLDMQNATTSDISKWAEEIRINLSKASKLRKNDPGSKKIKDDILKNIINSIKQASKETNLDENIEIEELEVPKLIGTFSIISTLIMNSTLLQQRTHYVQHFPSPLLSHLIQKRGELLRPDELSRYQNIIFLTGQGQKVSSSRGQDKLFRRWKG